MAQNFTAEQLEHYVNYWLPQHRAEERAFAARLRRNNTNETVARDYHACVREFGPNVKVRVDV